MAGKYTLGGAYYMWLAFMDTNGYPVGQNSTPDTKSNGTVYAPYVVEGFVRIGAPTPTYTTLKRRAGQRTTGTAVIGVEDYGNIPLTLSDHDETFSNMIRKVAPDASLATNTTITAPNLGQKRFPRFVAGFIGGGLDDDGNTVRLTHIYNNVQIRGGWPGVEEVQGEQTNPFPLEFTIDLSMSSRTGLGYLYSATALAVEDNEDGGILLRNASYGYLINTYIDDGSATTFTLSHKPASSDNAGATNYFTKNGVTNHANVSGLSTSTGATTHTAGSATDIWVVGFAIDRLIATS